MKRSIALSISIAALVALCVPWQAVGDRIGVLYNGTYYSDIYTLLSGITSDGNDTEINRLATSVKANAASPVAGTTGTFSGEVSASGGFSTPRQASDSVSGNKGQSAKWYEDIDDGDSQYTLQITALDGNFTDQISGSTRSSTLNFATTGNIEAANTIYPFRFVFDGGGSEVSDNQTAYVHVPWACTVASWNIISKGGSGSVVLRVYKDTLANFPPTIADSITSGHDPAISSATYATDTDLSDWSDVTIAAGEVLGVHVASCTTLTWVSLSLNCKLTK